MLDVDRYHRRSGGRGSRSRRRERAPPPAFFEWEGGVPDNADRGAVAGDCLLPVDGACGGEENGQGRQRVNALMSASDCSSKNPFQLNTLAFEHRGSSKKSGGTSIKMLIDQEMSKDMQSRRHSPGVVAKLMGLDTLPAQRPDYMQDSVSCLHKQSPEGFLEKHFLHDYRDPQEDFKDVFEDVETKVGMETRNWPVQKRLSKSRQRHKKMDYLRQKFLDAKRLSTDEKLQNSKQFCEALEVLESNKDLFLKLLREPSSLFIKHLEEYQTTSTSPEASHIMILKSCKVTGCKNNDMRWRSERKTEKNTHIRKDVVDKYESDFVSHCIREHNISLSKKLSKNKLDGKRESGSLPTHIVVLKPSLENVQGTRCQKNLQPGDSGYRRCRELRRSGTREMFSELRQQQVLSDDMVITQQTKGSREISKHMMHTVPDGSVKSCSLENSVCPRNKQSHRLPGVSTFMDFETLRQSSGHLGKRHSSSHSAETTVSREARKRLSERWKMTHKLQEVRAAGEGTSTLGEMLALSDREMMDMKRSAQNKLSGKEKMLARWGSPLGISSADAWKDERSPTSLLRSRSLPASSFNYGGMHGTNNGDNSPTVINVMNLGSSKSSVESIFDERLSSPFGNVAICSNSSQHSNNVVDENNHQMSEFNAEDGCQSCLDTKKLSEKKTTLIDSKDCDHCNESYLVDSVPVVCSDDAVLPCLTDEQQLPHSEVPNAPMDDEGSVVCDQKETVAKALSKDLPTDSLPCATEQACSPPVAGHPSPVSVLEAPDENESSPECFERVNEDLQELRMQIQLLKSESRDANAEGLVVLGEVADGRCDDVLQAGGNRIVFQDEDNMEFCYLFDVLANSGFHNANWDVLYYACYMREFPVGSDVFEKLEEMYSQFTWSRTERKLLFDLMNSILAGILAQSMGKHPWINTRRIRSLGCHNRLTDEVWQSLVRVRKDVVDDPVGTGMEDIPWQHLGDDIDLVGRKIERALTNDLLEELAYDVLSLDSSVYTCGQCGKNNILSA